MENLTKIVVDYINKNNLTGLKAGTDRDSFLEIWMVTVGDRIFARSWGFAEKSWYNTFIVNNKGKIKCGRSEFNIQAIIPQDLTAITDEINKAYLSKYNYGENAKYALGITEQKHIDKTLEFIVF
ncbi:DUF2255 family protein [Pedobacter nototheniae]|uniref:DUF2255 family protein n=1 Tax=Pedobacter nototheniae TaxID=2488994 RepID=UPI00293128CB|nr:DUF2255 family protein [Pedobacter nototheniae]